MDLDEIRDTFRFLDDWEDRYRFIIDIGKALPPLPESDKTDAALIRGCQSRLWLHSEVQDGRMTLCMDSDAFIVRGLIVIVLAACQGRPPAEICAFDMEALFDELGLIQHLSPMRGNGLRIMVGHIQALASQSA